MAQIAREADIHIDDAVEKLEILREELQEISEQSEDEEEAARAEDQAADVDHLYDDLVDISRRVAKLRF
jgi:hypothetical protein